MKINKTKTSFEKSIYKLNQNSNINNDNKNQINSDQNKSLNNLQNDLSSAAPGVIYQNNPFKINKSNFYHMLEVGFDKEHFRLFFYINEENNLIIELIPKDGSLPFSYKNVFDEDKFYKINKIFMELKTVEKIGEKIVNLFKKDKVLLGKNKKDDIFYLILKITVIDEDVDIYLPLNKNDDIQLCTINYLLKESEKLKNEFSKYINETEELIKNQNDEINELKKSNSLYLNIIKKIRNEYDKNKIIEEDEEIEGNEIIINAQDKLDKNDDENKELKKLKEIIIDEDEEYKNIEKKIEVMEKELKILDGNYKCDINEKYKILNLSINQTKPYVYIYFELSNIGLYPLTSNFDDIFCNIEDICDDSISFYNEQEKYIFLPEQLLPNQKIIVFKKIIINNPTINRKYDFKINIYSLNHGKISEEPLRLNIFIRETENQKNFLSFLNNKKFDFKYKNKKKKIILEHAIIPIEIDSNNLKRINIDRIKSYDRIKIKKFIYDEKSGMALEDKNKNKKINYNEEKKDINKNKEFFEIIVMINIQEIEKIMKKVKNKYKNLNNLNEFDNEKIEEIICSCLGDYDTICTFIEKMV